MSSFYSKTELAELGLKSCGKNVLISKKCSIYSPEKISIGNNVRIDDFSVLSGDITMGSNIHISAYCALYGNGGGGVLLQDYTGLSARVIVYSAIDDFSGDYAVGPMVDDEKRNLVCGKVIIEKYVQIGAGSCIFPNVVIREGVAVGAMSLVKCSLPAWGIYAGIPAKKIKERSQRLVKLLNT